jgi:hypothetical protein
MESERTKIDLLLVVDVYIDNEVFVLIFFILFFLKETFFD